MDVRRLPIEAEQLLVHRGKMRFADQLLIHENESSRVSFDVRRDNMFLKGDASLDPVIFVELIAQSVACHSGFARLIDGSQPKYGYLVGVKDFAVTGAAAPGDHLEVSVEKDSEFDAIVFVKGTIIKNGDETICSGILKCWESESEIHMKGAEPIPDPGTRFRIPGTLASALFPSEVDTAIMSRITHLSRDENTKTIVSDIYVDPGFIGFDGHFPGKPILPGIMMIKMGLLVLSIGLGKYFELKEVKQSKFINAVEPGHLIRITLSSPESADGTYGLQFSVSTSDTLCGKISASVALQE
jgi:3-hydroxymyristoyl/3-hydroxydecanoyl-(acyl carrier protein) dehydratase